MTLSSRIEALTGPDRAVDAEVFIAAFYPDWRIQTICEMFPEQVQPGRIQEPNGCGWRNAPAFTASLDAATSVVPEGWVVERAGWQSLPGNPPGAWFDLWQYRRDEDGKWWHSSKEGRVEATAPTPALALLAAAMQARGL